MNRAEELTYLAAVARRRAALLEMVAEELEVAPGDRCATDLRRSIAQFRAAHGAPAGPGRSES